MGFLVSLGLVGCGVGWGRGEGMLHGREADSRLLSWKGGDGSLHSEWVLSSSFSVETGAGEGNGVEWFLKEKSGNEAVDVWSCLQTFWSNLVLLSRFRKMISEPGNDFFRSACEKQ